MDAIFEKIIDIKKELEIEKGNVKMLFLESELNKLYTMYGKLSFDKDVSEE